MVRIIYNSTTNQVPIMTLDKLSEAVKGDLIKVIAFEFSEMSPYTNFHLLCQLEWKQKNVYYKKSHQ